MGRYVAAVSTPRYDDIGRRYATTHREDPKLHSRIFSLLGESRTVVNVGAGGGSYEPRDRRVLALEPSDVMAAQRPPTWRLRSEDRPHHS